MRLQILAKIMNGSLKGLYKCLKKIRVKELDVVKDIVVPFGQPTTVHLHASTTPTLCTHFLKSFNCIIQIGIDCVVVMCWIQMRNDF